jgi:hypothetical protein
MNAIRYVFQLMLGAWLGALLCFAGVFAPKVFSTLGPTPTAIDIVIRTLRTLDVASLAVLIALVVLAFVYEGALTRAAALRAGLLGGAWVLAAVSLFVVTPRLTDVHRRAGGSAAVLPATHPIRPEYKQLHRATAGAMSAELLLGFVAAGVFLRPRRRDQAALLALGTTPAA